jgi:nucleoside-diphosphate-sugar epimerase
MRIALVTGGAGFIGSHVVECLLRDGWQVRVLDNFSTSTPENLESCMDQLTLVQGDVCDAEVCFSAAEGVDSIFHLAGIASVLESVANPLHSHRVNLTGTINLLQAARLQGVRRFVLSSSASVYGNAEAIPTREDQSIAPMSPYASAKAGSELYCRNFWDLFGLETVILRYFNVFGPRQHARSGYAAAIPKFVEAAIMGKSPIVFGDGHQTRDFIYVENVAAANVLAATSSQSAGGTFNVAAGEAISLLDLLQELENAVGTPLNPIFKEERAGDVRHSRADVALAQSVLGFKPHVSFSEGIRYTLQAAKRAL